jgi:hypothetical protein
MPFICLRCPVRSNSLKILKFAAVIEHDPERGWQVIGPSQSEKMQACEILIEAEAGGWNSCADVHNTISCQVTMTETEFKKHLDTAEGSPKDIAAAVSGLSQPILRYKPSPEKWCVLEILGHLADVEIIYGYRLRQMLADTKPVIAPLDQDAWARNLNYLVSPPNELVAFYGLARHHNLRLLRTLAAADLTKSAFHPEMQRETTVAELVERMAGHGAGHLRQIEKLKAAAKEQHLGQ